MEHFVQVRNIKIGSGIPKICVPIVDTTQADIINTANMLAAAAPDLVEWRVDWFDHAFLWPEINSVLSDLRTALGDTPLLFTFRTSKEGGNKSIDSSAYSQLNKQAIFSGLIDLVDVEAFMDDRTPSEIIQSAHRYNIKVIASYHDFHHTPQQDEIVSRMKRMWDLGADIPKIAVMPQSKKDVLTLLAATEELARENRGPVITMSMAKTGLISRLCGEVFGSALTFGAIGRTSAPGQINIEDLREILALIHKNLS